MFVSTGTVIDNKFEVRDTIGAGGMGVVYEAFQLGIDREVALKVLTYAPADDPAELKRFEREAIILSRLAHPNIVQFHAYGIWCGYPYIAMQKLEGLSLAKLLAENETGIAPKRALEIAVQICRALQHAHEQGIFHRDIKPTNVILIKASDADTAYSQVKLIDFGLAKLTGVDGQQKLTQTGQALGSVMYMSPEQCQGQPVDARTDIYAVGCLLYQCLVGEAPFTADTGVAVMFRHINESITKAHGWYRISRLMQPVIARCMAKQPKDRYPDAGALLADLEQLLASDALIVSPPDGAKPDSAAPRPSLPFAADQKRGGKSLLYLCIAFLTGILIIVAMHLFDAQTNSSGTTGGDTDLPIDTSEAASLQRITSAEIAHTRGSLALRAWRYPEAARALKRANELLTADPSKVGLRKALTIKLDYAQALHNVSDYKSATAVLLEATVLAKKLTPQDEARACGLLCINSRLLRRNEDALKHGLRTVKLVEESNKRYVDSEVSRREAMHALTELAIVYEEMGNFKDAEAAKRKALKFAREQAHPDVMLNSLHFLASNLSRQGQNEEAAALMKEWEAVSDSIGKTKNNAIAEARSEGYQFMGQLKHKQGDIAGAERCFKAALLETITNVTAPHMDEIIGKRTLSLAALYYSAGRIDDGDKMAADALTHLQAANAEMEPFRKSLKAMKKTAVERLQQTQTSQTTQTTTVPSH